MTRQTQGKITHWNEEKGYGFITPSTGAKQVFVHVRAFKKRYPPPELNQPVSFSFSTDDQGRPCAAKVSRPGDKQPRNFKFIPRMILALVAVSFLLFIGWSVQVYKLPVQVLYVYLVASAFTFLIYAKDKKAAKSDARRTRENTLHALALFCGWPGALFAQQVLRHKSRKISFRLAFWITAIINCIVLGWLFWGDGAAFIRLLINDVSRNLPM